jgi:hypothetical protein
MIERDKGPPTTKRVMANHPTPEEAKERVKALASIVEKHLGTVAQPREPKVETVTVEQVPIVPENQDVLVQQEPITAPTQPEQPSQTPLPSLDEMMHLMMLEPERPCDDRTMAWVQCRTAMALQILIRSQKWFTSLKRVFSTDHVFAKAELDKLTADLQELNKIMAPRRGAARKAKTQAKAEQKSDAPPTVPEQPQPSDTMTLKWSGMVPCGSSPDDSYSNHSAAGPGGIYTAMVNRKDCVFTHYSVSFVRPDKKGDKVEYLGSAKALETAKQIAQQHADTAKAEA